ncbi:hypothetical protein DMENIID0001_061490 [Sergentomyia squamirostris]
MSLDRREEIISTVTEVERSIQSITTGNTDTLILRSPTHLKSQMSLLQSMKHQYMSLQMVIIKQQSDPAKKKQEQAALADFIARYCDLSSQIQQLIDKEPRAMKAPQGVSSKSDLLKGFREMMLESEMRHREQMDLFTTTLIRIAASSSVDHKTPDHIVNPAPELPKLELPSFDDKITQNNTTHQSRDLNNSPSHVNCDPIEKLPLHKSATTSDTSAFPHNCLCCSESPHSIHKCRKFLNQSAEERFNTVKKLSLCRNCLANHKTNTCKYYKCKKCQVKHNILLHDYFAIHIRIAKVTESPPVAPTATLRANPPYPPASARSASAIATNSTPTFTQLSSDSSPDTNSSSGSFSDAYSSSSLSSEVSVLNPALNTPINESNLDVTSLPEGHSIDSFRQVGLMTAVVTALSAKKDVSTNRTIMERTAKKTVIKSKVITSLNLPETPHGIATLMTNALWRISKGKFKECSNFRRSYSNCINERISLRFAEQLLLNPRLPMIYFAVHHGRLKKVSHYASTPSFLNSVKITDGHIPDDMPKDNPSFKPILISISTMLMIRGLQSAATANTINQTLMTRQSPLLFVGFHKFPSIKTSKICDSSGINDNVKEPPASLPSVNWNPRNGAFTVQMQFIKEGFPGKMSSTNGRLFNSITSSPPELIQESPIPFTICNLPCQGLMMKCPLTRKSSSLTYMAASSICENNHPCALPESHLTIPTEDTVPSLKRKPKGVDLATEFNPRTADSLRRIQHYSSAFRGNHLVSAENSNRIQYYGASPPTMKMTLWRIWPPWLVKSRSACPPVFSDQCYNDEHTFIGLIQTMNTWIRYFNTPPPDEIRPTGPGPPEVSDMAVSTRRNYSKAYRNLRNQLQTIHGVSKFQGYCPRYAIPLD